MRRAFLNASYAIADDQHRGTYANMFTDALMKAPLFDIDEALRQIGRSGLTTMDRVARILNQRHLGIRNVLDASDQIGDRARTSLPAKAS